MFAYSSVETTVWVVKGWGVKMIREYSLGMQNMVAICGHMMAGDGKV